MIDGDRRRRLAELDAALLHLVVLADDEDVVALLVGQHRGARHRQRLGRLDVLQQRRSPARRRPAHGRLPCARIGHCAAQHHGVGVAGHRVVDEVELARSGRTGCRRAGGCGSTTALPALRRSALRSSITVRVGTGKTTYIGSWLTIVASVPRARG